MNDQRNQEDRKPTLSLDDYNRRAKERLVAIDRLAARIDFSSDAWMWTAEGDRYQRLMSAQAADEAAAGL